MGTSESQAQLQMPCQEERQISTGYCQTFPVSLNNSRSSLSSRQEKCRVHSEPCLLYVTKVRHEKPCKISSKKTAKSQAKKRQNLKLRGQKSNLKPKNGQISSCVGRSQISSQKTAKAQAKKRPMIASCVGTESDRHYWAHFRPGNQSFAALSHASSRAIPG